MALHIVGWGCSTLSETRWRDPVVLIGYRGDRRGGFNPGGRGQRFESDWVDPRGFEPLTS